MNNNTKEILKEMEHHTFDAEAIDKKLVLEL